MGNSYSQLTLIKRYQIQAFKELNYSARKIAKKLECSNKTISAELKRCTIDNYCAETAHNHALLKRKNAPKANKRTDDIVRLTHLLLGAKMTPEQIAGRMKLESFPEPISRQTIYRLVHQSNGKASFRAKVSPTSNVRV